MLDDIEQEIERCQKSVISFDIFDTLIIREHFWPTKIFRQVGENLNNLDYFYNRINAESSIRKKYSHFEDIKYDYLKDILSAEFLSKELEIEFSSCKANPDVLALYQKAHILGYKIIAISDMYLDKEILRKILNESGYTNISEIYVSSEYHKTKASGALFKKVLEEECITSQDLIHIGDNRHSDVNASSALGILSFYYEPITEQLRRSKKVSPQMINALERSGSVGGLLAYQFWNKWTKITEDRTYWYRFGYNYTGPVLMGFCRYLADELKKNSLRKLYFMSRDGELMLAGFKKMFPELADCSEYLYSSRRMYLFSSITELDDDTLNYLSSGASGSITVQEYFNRLCIETSEAREKFFSHFDDCNKVISNKKDIKKLHAAFLSISSYILDEAKLERDNLLVYLDRIGVLSPDDPIGVVDIGWAASSQKFLEKIIDRKINGFYLGTGANCYPQSLIKGYLFDRGQPESICDSFFSCIELIELLFIGKHAAITKIGLVDNQPIPSFLDICKDEEQRMLIAKEIHQGALDFIDETFDLLKKWNTYPDELLINNLLTTLLSNPELEDIVNIGRVPHNANMGKSSYTPIIDWPLSEKKELSTISYLKIFFSLFYLKKVPHIYWLEGLKKYFILTKNKSFLTLPIQHFLIYTSSQRRPDRVFHNLFCYIKQYVIRLKKKPILTIRGTSNTWALCSTGAKIKWFNANQSSYIDFEPLTGIFLFKKSGTLNISGTFYIGDEVTSEIYLYHIKKSLKVKSSFLLIHHNGPASGEASISFNLVIKAKRGESFFLSTKNESASSQAQVLCSSTHSFISIYPV